MKRVLWGEFQDKSDKNETRPHECIFPKQKTTILNKLKSVANRYYKQNINNVNELKCENNIITQSVEVMNQNEILQSLIDTYANKTSINNHNLGPCQLIPQIDFPKEIYTDLTWIYDEKFMKPFWVLPQTKASFVSGQSKCHPKINKQLAREAVMKSLCGLLRIEGFNDISQSALKMLIDLTVEFMENFVFYIRDAKINTSTDKSSKIDILTLEKSYNSFRNDTLISLHNYFKNKVININQLQLEEFKNLYGDFGRLIKESQDMQKSSFLEEDYMQFLDFSSTPLSNDISNVTLINLLETNQPNARNLKDIFDGVI